MLFTLSLPLFTPIVERKVDIDDLFNLNKHIKWFTTVFFLLGRFFYYWARHSIYYSNVYLFTTSNWFRFQTNTRRTQISNIKKSSSKILFSTDFKQNLRHNTV